MKIPVAIVAMDCVLPGATGTDEFLKLLLDGVDARRSDDSRLNGSEDDPAHRLSSRRGGFLDAETRSWARRLADLPPDADDATCWAAVTTRRALAQIQGDALDRRRTGLYLGCYTFPTHRSAEISLSLIREEIRAGMCAAGQIPGEIQKSAVADFVPAGDVDVAGVVADVVASSIGLGGPRMVLDAACASGLYAVRLACDALEAGQADTMIAGAVCAPDLSLLHLSFSDLSAYGTGMSAPFREGSTGITTGEGAAVVVLRRLEDALRDGNDIRAVIDGAAISNDGAGHHPLAPAVGGQRECYELAYRRADLAPGDIDYVECHATGTALGDQAELTSLAEFFGSDLPLLGSAKGNIGHLLTAAGISSLIKVVLCLESGTIPPTVGSATDTPLLHDNVVTTVTQWPEHDRPRRAAVSAFGFGGANAHLIVSRNIEEAPDTASGTFKSPDVHLVGLGAYLAGGADVADILKAEWAGDWSRLRETPHLGAVPFEPIRDRIPPRDIGNMNPLPQAVWHAARTAMADADLPFGQRRSVGVVVSLDLDPRAHEHLARLRTEDLVGVLLPDESPAERHRIVEVLRDAIHEPIGANEVMSYIGSLVAARISSLADITGPSLTVSAGPLGVVRAVEAAQLMLADPAIEAVVIAAVDRATATERSHLIDPGAPLLDGAVGFVVARSPGPRGSYGVVQSVSSVTLPSEVKTDDVDYVDLHAANGSRRLALLSTVSNATDQVTAKACATNHDWGDAGNAVAGLMLLRLALSLHHRVLPGTHLQSPEVLRDVPFRPRPWLPTSGRRRNGLLLVEGHGSTQGHLRLADPEISRRPADPATAWAAAGGPKIMELRASDRESLITALSQVGGQGSHSVHDGPERVVLVGADEAALQTEANRVISSLTENPGIQRWSSPAGSRYNRCDRDGAPDVAFAYPGAFTTFPGYGAELLRAIPAAMDILDSLIEITPESSGLERLYPRIGEGPEDRRALMLGEQELMADVPFMLGVGTTFAMLYTDLFGDLLNVRPCTTIGYSLGASSMLFATGVWDRRHRTLESIRESPVFQGELAGDLRAIRRHFGVDDTTGGERIWRTIVVLGPSHEIAEAVASSPDLFLTHVNTPMECVVAGRPDAVTNFVAEHDWRWAPSPVTSPLHTPLATQWSEELVGMHRFVLGETTSAVPIDSVTGKPLMPLDDTDLLAEQMATAVMSPVDFPLLVAAAAQQADLLVEAGPGGTCARWAADSVPSLVTAAPDRRGADLTVTWAAFLATLLTEGVEIDLTPYCTPTSPGDATAPEIRSGRSIRESVRDALGTLAEVTSPPIWDVDSAAMQGWWTIQTVEPKPTLQPAVLESPPIVPVVPVAAVHHEALRVVQETHPAAHIRLLADAITHIRRQTLEAHSLAMKLQHRQLVQVIQSAGEPLGSGFDPDADPGEWHHDVSRPAPLAPPSLPSAPAPQAPTKPAGIVFDESDLLEFATGSAARAFGPAYAPLDDLAVRVRLPAPPYHFVTRAVHLSGQRGRFERSEITTEYDVPEDAWFSVDGGVPPAVTIEAGQADLLLVAWLGIDFENKGERVYRLLDSTLVFHGDLPQTGQILRYEIVIDRFVHNGPTTLFYFGYRCYADDELILELTRATAGFFSADELASPLGILSTSQPGPVATTGPDTPWVKPVAVTERHELGPEHLAMLAVGDIVGVFGPEHGQPRGTNPALRLPDERLRMIHRLRIEPRGGSHGLARVEAWFDLEPDGWYFTSHFPDDPVLAGSLVAEGAVQALQVLLLHHGFHLVLPDARFQTIPGLETEVSVRGQVVPGDTQLRLELDVHQLTLLPRPTAVADVLVYRDDLPIVRMRNFGVQIREKAGTDHRPGLGGKSPFLGRLTSRGLPAVVNELQLEHAAMGDLGQAMGPEFDIYQQRRAPHIPNRDFRFVDRIESVTGTRGQLVAGMEMITEYDAHADSWYFRETPGGSMPHAVLLESALQSAILLGYYQGATLDQEDVDFSIRNLDGTAEIVGQLPRPGSVIRQQSKLLFSSAVEGNVLQKFSFELEADDQVFYRGESVFGYFSESALASQVGLDAGKRIPPRSVTQEMGPSDIALDASELTRRYRARDDRLALPGGRLDLLHEVHIRPTGGTEGLGSIWGRRDVHPDDWYFTRHFHRDPVQPGSLGIEAMLQALQVLALELGLDEGIVDPVVEPAPHVAMSWTYRGQVLRSDEECSVEVDIRRIERSETSVAVVGNGSLWKGDLRIYEVTDLAVVLKTMTAQDTSMDRGKQ